MKITRIAIIAILLCILVSAAPTLAQLQPVENMWGEIHHTILDMEPETPETPASPQGWTTCGGGTVADPAVEWFSDFVYAYTGEEEIDTAGHAIVWWWLIGHDDQNEAAILSIMEWLGECPDAGTEPCGCGGYPPAPSLTPKERIDAVWTLNKAPYTTWDAVSSDNSGTAITTPDGFYWLDVDPSATRIKTVTQDDLPTETRGLTMARSANVAASYTSELDKILVVTLTEYPVDYHGEKPVCIEMGKKLYSGL